VPHHFVKILEQKPIAVFKDSRLENTGGGLFLSWVVTSNTPIGDGNHGEMPIRSTLLLSD
jgi:hypothetical protein